MKLVIIDNYDSFTYNLVQYCERILSTPITVLKNDAFKVEELEAFDKILFSPGPGIPKEVPQLFEVLKAYQSTKSILGVCLGHQAIGEFYGGLLVNTQRVFHGVSSTINVIKKEELFKDFPEKWEAGRYHSWLVDTEGFPFDELEITAQTPCGSIMAIRHRKWDVKGVQFHPESILTPMGFLMIKNWIST